MSPAAGIPDGSVIITPVEMYHQQQEMSRTLLGVSTKLDAMVGKLDHYQEDQARRLELIDGKDGEIAQLKTRVSSLERWRWRSAGVASGISAVVASGATALITKAVLGH